MCSPLKKNCYEEFSFPNVWMKLVGETRWCTDRTENVNSVNPDPCSWLDPSCVTSTRLVFSASTKSVSWSNCAICQRNWSRFTREMWYVSATLNQLNGEFNCQPRNLWLLRLRLRGAKKEKKNEWMPFERIINERGLTLPLLPVTISVSKRDFRFKGPYQCFGWFW